MRSHRGKLLMTALGALALGATAFGLAAPAEAGMSIASLGKAPSSAIQRIADRCQVGFHEINAPNGNGYRCVQNGD